MMQDVSLAAAFGRLLIVALLMAGVLYLLRRTSARGRRVTKRGPQRAIELLDRQSLGKAQSVAVLRVHGCTLVVGVTDHRVELLTVFDPPEDQVESRTEEIDIDLARLDMDRDGADFFERLRSRSAR
jgi:flagellar biosynthetic protein FliO